MVFLELRPFWPAAFFACGLFDLRPFMCGLLCIRPFLNAAKSHLYRFASYTKKRRGLLRDAAGDCNDIFVTRVWKMAVTLLLKFGTFLFFLLACYKRESRLQYFGKPYDLIYGFGINISSGFDLPNIKTRSHFGLALWGGNLYSGLESSLYWPPLVSLPLGFYDPT